MPAPLRNNGPVTPAVTNAPTTTPRATTPTEATTPRGWSPAAGGAVTVATNTAFNAVAGALKKAGPSPFELVAGRTPDAVSLTTVLSSLGASPQGQAAVNKVLEDLQTKTGLSIPPQLRAEVLSNPAALTNVLQVSVGQMSSGLVGVNAAFQAGKLKQAEEGARLLPQKFDFAQLDSIDAPRPKPELKQLAPGLFQGDLPSATPDARVKLNRVVAEVFDRLSNNPSLPAGERFSVTHGGKEFTSVDAFAKHLKAEGYEVNVAFESRVANFSNLKTPVPGSDPVKFLDVPAPLMVKTGVRDGLGKEAVVPAAHSEMVISIKAGPNVKGVKLDADLKFYQGISGTGFFPRGLYADPSWCGRVTHDTLSGDKALEALTLAGAFTDLVDATAKDKNLYAGGYGITGVCNDSVAVVQQALTGRADMYPLLMKDSMLHGALRERLNDGDKTDDASYRALSRAMRELPSDTRKNDSQATRALKSLPWVAGREPFASSEDARRILSGAR